MYADEEIITMIQAGNEKALVHLYQCYHKMVKNYVVQNSGDEEDADDILQDTLVIVWEKIITGMFVLQANVQLSTYIFAVMKNLWLKRLRKKSKISATEIEEYDLPEESDEGQQEQYEIVAQCLKELGETCQQLLTHFYFEKMNMEEIATLMNFANAQTAKAKKYQCQKKLEEIIKTRYNASDIF